MRGEDGYNESLHSLVVNVQAGANGRAERDVAAELLQDVARPDRRITKQVWALRKVVFGTLYESRTWTSFLRRLHGARLRKSVLGHGNSQKSRLRDVARFRPRVSAALGNKHRRRSAHQNPTRQISMCHKCAYSVR